MSGDMKAEESEKRDKFSNKLEYFLTALSYAVGLGNVWRSVSVPKSALVLILCPELMSRKS